MASLEMARLEMASVGMASVGMASVGIENFSQAEEWEADERSCINGQQCSRLDSHHENRVFRESADRGIFAASCVTCPAQYHGIAGTVEFAVESSASPARRFATARGRNGNNGRIGFP